MDNKLRYVGIGIYSISEASRLTGINSQSIRRCLLGYSRKTKGGVKSQLPVFSTDYEPIDGNIALSFLDLTEMLFASQFRTYGVSWHTIRLVSQMAAEQLKSGHPFSMYTFKTDGKAIFLRTLEENPKLLDIVTGQYQIDEIIDPYLYDRLDFQFDMASSWWPQGKDRGVVVDPKRSFGRSIVDTCGIPTTTLMESYRTTNSISKVASWYEISEKSV